MNNSDRSTVSAGSGGTANSLPYAVGIVAEDAGRGGNRRIRKDDEGSLGSLDEHQMNDRPGQRNGDDTQLGLGLSKRWGNQDCDWPVVATPPTATKPLIDKEDGQGDWSASLDDEFVKNKWADEYLWDIPAESSVEKTALTQQGGGDASGGKGGRRRGSGGEGTPGAYNVRDGGLSRLFGRAHIQDAGDDDYSEYSDFEFYDTRWSHWRIAVCLLCTVLIGLSVGLAVVMLSDSDEGGSSNKGITPSDDSSSDSHSICDFSSQEQPNPLLQCSCNGNITVITDPLMSQYQDLLHYFVPLVVPEFDVETSISSPTSCQLQNLALWWLAMDILHNERDDLSTMRNRYTLALLYTTWKGEDWKRKEGWLNLDEDECNWYGVQCNRKASVSGLDLSNNLLKGTIPSEIHFLYNLVKFDISGNEINGAIPEDLYTMTALEDLVLWDNQINGTISESVGKLSNLKEFQVDNNYLSGTLPKSLSKLSKLVWFMVAVNDLDGRVFDLAMNWPDLVGLLIGGNSFDGEIPDAIGTTLPKLRILDLSANHFVGTLPTELGLLVEMEEFAMDGHNLLGSIPTELGNWRVLKHLAITTGTLKGSIPSEMGQMSILESLFLSENQLMGTIPTELGLCSVLVNIDLRGNDVSGPVPSELGQLGYLKLLDLSWTEVTGVAPEELCSNHFQVGGGELETFHTPCYDYLCVPETCCNACCTPGCG